MTDSLRAVLLKKKPPKWVGELRVLVLNCLDCRGLRPDRTSSKPFISMDELAVARPVAERSVKIL